MPIRTIQILAGLAVAIALCLAFIAAGVGAAIILVALVLGAVLAWLAWTSVRGILRHRRPADR